METVVIASGLLEFRLIRRICRHLANGLCAEANLDDGPLYTGLEAMAQLAALHVRRHLQFERHAFLLKVYRCRMPAVDILRGRFKVEVLLRNHSSEAFIYDAAAKGSSGIDFNGKLLIGTRDYDERFSREKLKAHYQRVWTDLNA